MIAVDTSVLISFVLRDPRAPLAVEVIRAADRVLISAGTLTEALIVGTGLGLRADVIELIDWLGIEVAEVTSNTARRIGEIYQRWGKGFHPAGLNFGDCFSYELADRHSCPLLYFGNDFARTDIQSAI